MNYLEEVLYLGKRLMGYESVYGHGGFSKEAIYGKTIRDCLQDMLDYCESMGLKTYMDPEGAYAYAETGPGDAYIGILTHLDIVSAGDVNQWTHDPFEPTVVEDKLIGRGAADDKIPAAIGVLLVKKLLDDGIDLKYPIRLIFGGDEETGFRGIGKYKKHHQPPKYTLVFDGTFPFSYSEKHLLDYELHVGSQIKLQGGVGYNSVMDHVVWQKGDELVEVTGKSAHASRPHEGENALVKLAALYPNEDPLLAFVSAVADGMEKDGLGLIKDEELWPDLTLNFGKVKHNVISADIRIPPEVDLDSFIEAFEEKMEDLGAAPRLKDRLDGSKTDTESPFAKTVLKCYRDTSGDMDTEVFRTGSATYGRSFDDNCLSFGPRMSYHITNIHKPNEFIPFDLIENAFEIYVHTLKTIEEDL